MPDEESRSILGFITTEELVAIGREAWSDFSRKHLWALVALGLVPHPQADFPTENGRDGYFPVEWGPQLCSILKGGACTVRLLQKRRMTMLGQDGLAYEPHKVVFSVDHTGPAGDKLAVASPSLNAAFSVAIDLGIASVDRSLFGRYLRMMSSPRTNVEWIAFELGCGEDAFGWGHSDREIAVFSRMVERRLLSHKARLDGVLNAVSSAISLVESWRRSFQAWSVRSSAHNLQAELATRRLGARNRDGLRDFALLRMSTLRRYLSVALEDWGRLLFGVTWLGLLWLLHRGYDGTLAGSYSTTVTAMAISAWYFRSDYRRTFARTRLTPRIEPVIGSFLGLVFVFAGAYLAGGQVIPALREPLSCVYFSVVTITTTGYGDIAPSGPMRLAAAAEMLFGLAYSVLIVGVVAGRWLNRRAGSADQG